MKERLVFDPMIKQLKENLKHFVSFNDTSVSYTRFYQS